ncbi:MAG: hypothetical protein KatS3mg068_2736 [Candidatus Sericytochromatia bacterium]|nr:MAG: hypothetical protein KatS3mg068_2736 [Candidatus Sericytochromatia bacterium]
MTKETKNNDHPEGCIYELFIYFPDLIIYQNSSYMNELSEMPAVALERFKKKRKIILWRGKLWKH